MTIREAILNNVVKWNDCGFTLWDIGNGKCEEFAAAVIKDMGGYSDDLYEISAANFWIEDLVNGGTSYKLGFDWMLLKQHWGFPIPNSEEAEILNQVGRYHHEWIVYKKRFYDAETPDGVGSFFDLPFFKRHIADLKTKSMC